MTMTVRIPIELDKKLSALAEAQHSSKHAVLLRALTEHLDREIKTRLVIESLDETSHDYADLITRLEDA
ncbi:MAG: ribbon-helix-helix protein, CopG family [Pseudolysinimonas sp.]